MKFHGVARGEVGVASFGLSRAEERCTAYIVMVVVAAASACAWVASATAAQSFEYVVGPGKVVEQCVHLDAGSEAKYAFTASGPLDFNIHFHMGRQVDYPVRVEAISSSEGIFKAGSAQEYCWMWTNGALEPVALRGTIE